MLNDKIQEYKKSKTMLKNTPAMYKKTYSFLKEVDSLALANVQLHLEKAYKNFFRDPKVGFPRFKSKHHSKNSYTTNVVNGNILVEGNRIRLPKLKWISMKKHRETAENCRLKSVTVSMEPSGKYFASLLYEGYSCDLYLALDNGDYVCCTDCAHRGHLLVNFLSSSRSFPS